MPQRAFCRLYAPTNNTQFVLDGSTVDVLIADVHASVEISQRFINPLDVDVEATYNFGLLASAAICGFKMVRADGAEVEGIVKEKEEAKKEYEEAVKQGYTAALGAEDTKDVFSISVGNINAKETVVIKLRYLQTLTDDEKRDQVRFVFPRTYAQRYGSAPTVNATSASTIHQCFSMNVTVQQASSIKGISCPSGHPMQLVLGKPDGFAVDDSVPDPQMAKVIISDPSGSLSQDIRLVITAAGLDNPRCFIEAHSSLTSNDTVAMGLTFVPRFTLPDHPGGMEYIFVVDRSGSMGGDSINLVREALVVLLRGLPSKGTKFNIVSFGSRSTKFWESSQAYTQSNMEAATAHVDSMQADYGGTEIASALDLVFSSLSTPLSKPVAVFLLTDGAAWDVAGCVAKTKNAIATQATRENFMRVFTVGIGNGASTDTCDSIAKAGGGISVYVGPNEPIVGKCSRLVRAARTPPVQDFRIFWTGDDPSASSDEDDFELVEDDTETLVEASKPLAANTSVTSVAVSLFDSNAKDNDDGGPSPTPAIQLPPPYVVQQAPLQPQSLFPGTRSQLYAIVAKKQTPLPKTIKVRGTVVTTGTIVELEVPVRELAQSQGSRQDFLHVLAAKALISDRENQIHDFSPAITSSFKDNDELRDAYLKADIVRLGVKYGLSSRYTSFVAIDRRVGQIQTPVPASVIPNAVTIEGPSSGSHAMTDGSINSARRGARRFMLASFKRTFQPPVQLAETQTQMREVPLHPGLSICRYSLVDSTIPSISPSAAAMNSILGSPNENTAERRTRRSAPAPVVAPMAPPPPSVFDHAIPSPPPSATPAQQELLQDSFQTLLTPRSSRGTSSSAPGTTTASSRSVTIKDSEDVAWMTKGARLAAVARLQQFDGRFELSEGLLTLLGITLGLEGVQGICARENLHEGVVATVLARAWLFKNGDEESLDMQEKALEWVGDQLGDGNAMANVVKKIEQLITVP
ncbi:hypothetical protein DL96DRAFT_1814096 [Flagelloscypha sp. PMI_526]|nr:hypothetical protein DL96DRAFT_1814096 [Flagelloscypha sp. PMI_526]